MSFVSFGSFLSIGSSINPSIAWARGKRGEGRFRITLPLDSAWYTEQPCTRFRSLQHRKERNGFQHEFIVLKLEDNSICRTERMGDPDASFDAIGAQGITAHDVIQSFAPDKLSNAHLDTSDVVAEITFPRSLDLEMVLLICRAMQEGAKTCNYTLQIFNCYFFSLAIQAALTRLVADWETPFRDEIWHSAVKKGLSALSDIYEAALSARDQQPFILRIYSAVRPDTRWPAEDLMCELQRGLWQYTEVSQACNTVLWFSDMGLAVDYVLCRRARDVAVGILKAKAPSSEDLLLELISQAVSRHEQELQAPKLNRVQQCMQRKTDLMAEFESFRSKAQQAAPGFLPSMPQSHSGPPQPRTGSSKPRPDPPPPHSTSPRPRLGTSRLIYFPFFRVSHISVWITYAKVFALWTLHVVLGLLGIDLLGSAQPVRCVFIEDELEPSLAILKAPEHRSADEFSLISQTLQSLIAAPPLLMQWKEWPWDHIYQPIKRHVPELLVKEKGMLQVSFSNSTNQATTVSRLQEHLLERIRDHAKRVEYFNLGSAAKIQDEMEDRISQVWASIRLVDTTPAPVASSMSPNLLECMERTRDAIETILKIGQSFAELVPIAKGSAVLCTQAWETLGRQDHHDALIAELVTKMGDVLPHVAAVEDHTKLANLQNTLRELLLLVEDASLFVIEYKSDGAAVRAVRTFVPSSAQGQVDEFVDRFGKLKEIFDRGIATQVMDDDALVPDNYNPSATMASKHPAKYSKTSRRRIQEIELTPAVSVYPIEIKILVDGQEIHRLPRIEKKNVLHWKDLILPWQANDLRDDSNLTIQITEIHTIKDRVGLAVYRMPQVANNDTVSAGEDYHALQRVGGDLIISSEECHNTKYITKVVFQSQDAARRAYADALSKAQQLESRGLKGTVGTAFKTLLQLGSTLSELDPTGGSKIAFAVCTKAWEYMERLVEPDAELDELVRSLARMAPAIESVQQITDPNLEDTATEMLNLIEDASLFILKPRPRTDLAKALRSMIDSSTQDQINDLIHRFRRLREEFDTRVGTQTLTVGVETLAVHSNSESGRRSEGGNCNNVDGTRLLGDQESLAKLSPAGHAIYNPDRACISGTRARVIEDIIEWSNDNKQERILWVYGLAGLGKSSVATSVCQRLDEEGSLAACFFCKRDDPALRDPRSLLNTIVYELATRNEAYKRAVADAIREDQQICGAPIQRRYASLVETPLKNLGQYQAARSLVIVVDALDETERDENRASLLIYLRDMCQLVPWLKIIITSRPDDDIKKAFGRDVKFMTSLNIADHDATDDIVAYVRRRMSAIPVETTGRDQWPDEEEVRQLSAKSNRVFVRARTACNLIQQSLDPGTTLKKILAGQLSEALWE